MNATINDLSDFHIRPLSESRTYPLSFLENEIYPILISGIVNPFGPTLTVIAAVRDNTSSPLTLVYSYLNPFGSELFIPGYLFDGQLTDRFSEQLLRTLSQFNLFESGAPSLCIPSQHLDLLDTRHIYTNLITNYPSLGDLFDRLKRYPLNPWDRISEEMGVAMKGRTGDQSADSQMNPDFEMGPKDVQSLLDIVLSPEHNKAELSAFLYAWKGSIEQTSIGAEMRDSAYQYDDFVPLLSHLLEAAGFNPQ